MLEAVLTNKENDTMYKFKIHYWLNGKGSRKTVTASNPIQAREIFKYKFPDAMITDTEELPQY